MSYDPENLLAELEHYQKQAEEDFHGNLQHWETFHPYGSTVAKETGIDVPKTITLETCDDILPLTIWIEDGPEYRLESFKGDQATYRIY